eukprot:TRINITY_DN5507_c0_g1_i1.p1 TRINITY_DN5507_c0_g1~~TRINITY_DN5507_c0_g1_i1.p1  ORF type:complete len:684 (-),score=156.11 TRINITY_DN5507_c0_g1_i1:2253-4304(-)
MKPNEDVFGLGNQVIYKQVTTEGEFIQVKSESHESSPASEALQLIFADSNVDAKSMMFDLTKLLNEDHNLTAINPTRIAISAPGAPPMLIPKRSQTNTFLVSTSEGMQMDMDDTFSAPQTTPSSSFGPFGNGSSYGASPLAQISPSTWDQRYTIVKQETEGPGLALSGGHAINLSPGGSEYFNLQNAGPTLAQLNSPPNEDLITLKAFGDLDSLNLDIEALTGDLLSQYPVEIKTEYVPVSTFASMSPWSRANNLSTSVPTPVISHVSDFHELSNLSNGGPSVSPNRLTLSPPVRSTFSPISQPRSPNMHVLSPVSSHHQIPSTVPINSSLSPNQSSQHSTLHELLMRKEPQVPDPIRSRSNSNQFKSAKRPIVNRQRNSLSMSNPLLVSQLSKSAPVKNLPLDNLIWTRRDPRPHMNSICSIGGDSSIADEVSDVLNSLSPSELNDIDSEDEDITNKDYDSEEDLRIDEDDLASITGGSGKGKERHFWQYNVQAKGPKGQKLALDTKIHDPHKLNDIIDPVFSDNVSVHGIKHSGKARRGDGNDLTANPAKLAKIGKELEKLGKEINLMTPVSEVPFPTRTKSRKEKNKLASRACRLKKKAQHEANKLKLHGLEEEHNDLMRSMQQVKRILHAKWSKNGTETSTQQEDLTAEAERILKKIQTKNKVSGNTTDYVNRMIAKYS